MNILYRSCTEIFAEAIKNNFKIEKKVYAVHIKMHLFQKFHILNNK